MELSVVMPCLNEAKTLPACIRKAQTFLRESGVDGEVIVADNGSTDGSPEIARELGARVVPVPAKGYGAALSEGIYEALGTFVIMGDSDDSYDFSALQPFVDKLREGFDLVMGNRFLGGISEGAMPFMHRYVGNPMLSALGRRIYGNVVCQDFYCGLRGFRKDTITRLNIQSTGMEFALEMIIKAELYELKITEVPTTLSRDGRGRKPHLRTYRDGWRSLRLYLLMSPRWTFGIPGIILSTLGLATLAASVLGFTPAAWIGAVTGWTALNMIFTYWPVQAQTLGIEVRIKGIVEFSFAMAQSVAAFALAAVPAAYYFSRRIPFAGIFGVVCALFFAFSGGSAGFIFGAVAFGIYSAHFFNAMVFHSMVEKSGAVRRVALNEVFVGLSFMMASPLASVIHRFFPGFTGSYTCIAFLIVAGMILEWAAMGGIKKSGKGSNALTGL